MEFEPGALVAIKKADLMGTVVKRRLPNEDIYLVRINAQDRYYSAESLEVIPEGGVSLTQHSKDWNEELVHLANLVNDRSRTGFDIANEPEILESLEKLGIIVPIQSDE